MGACRIASYNAVFIAGMGGITNKQRRPTTNYGGKLIDYCFYTCGL
jgi:hypothetical protein